MWDIQQNNFACVQYCAMYWCVVYCEGVDCKVTAIKCMTVFITRRVAACFSRGYNYIAALSSWERYILCS